MTAEEALTRARSVPPFSIILTTHAQAQMKVRRVQARDIIRALGTATSAIAQNKPTKWRFEGGIDIDGDDLIVVASFEDNGVVIVSVFA